MASLSKTYQQEKLLGQIYTPDFIVAKILDEVGYDGSAILGKKILDPACGDGRFLCQVAQRLIKYSPKEDLKQHLEQMYGWDIDENAVQLCRENLEKLVQDLDLVIDWNISQKNALHTIPSYEKTFDFIVGNPPYIRIQHLEAEERIFLQNEYKFCKKGSTDIYIAFYELCTHLLKNTGICGLITPNTFFFTQTGQPLRQYFGEEKNIISICNYSDIQVFENATTYSAIVIFGKVARESFRYEQAISLHNFAQRQISFEEIIGANSWQLSVEENIQNNGVKLKDICKIHVGITTLADAIFIMKYIKTENDLIHLQAKNGEIIIVEKAITKPIIKASKLKKSDEEITEYVIFPYEKEANKTKVIAEAVLQEKYPLAYQYLLSVKDILDKRDNGKSNKAAWYAFGRSQGLETSFGKKILFSPMNSQPNFIYSANEEATFYSGYCIKYNGDYQWLANKLNSEHLAAFMARSSRDFRGGWKAYNKTVLEQYVLPE